MCIRDSIYIYMAVSRLLPHLKTNILACGTWASIRHVGSIRTLCEANALLFENFWARIVLDIICWRPVIQYVFPRAVLTQKAQRKQRPSFQVVGMQTSSCSFHDKLHLKLNCWCAFVCGSLTPSAIQAFIYRSQISALKILCSIVIVSLGFSNNKQGVQHMLVI